MNTGTAPEGGSGVRRAVAAEVDVVARLHVNAIGEGFLATLGRRFLARLYRRMLRSERSFVLVAADGTDVLGFVAVAEDTRAFYREFLLRDGFIAGMAALQGLLRRPRHVWETLRYGASADVSGLPRAEVLAVAVDAAARGRGLGTRLLEEALSELGRRGVRSARVVTVPDNEAARRMYEAAGFERRATIELHHGVAQDVLVWK